MNTNQRPYTGTRLNYQPTTCGSDDQFWLFDYCIRYGKPVNFGNTPDSPQMLNGYLPFDHNLHALVEQLKKEEAV